MIKQTWMFLILYLIAAVGSVVADDRETLKIGVLSTQSDEQVIKRWSPTANYLSDSIPNKLFSIVPIDYGLVTSVVARGSVDFLIIDPVKYVGLEKRYNLSALLTMQKALVNGQDAAVLSSAIIVKSGRDDINSIADLVNKSFVAVDEFSFSGWAMAWRQMRTNGLSPYRDLGSLDFVGSDEGVINAVKLGAIDAGSIRSGVLEKLIAKGTVDRRDFKVLPEVLNPSHQPYEFPLKHSTVYYPEWPFAKLSHIDDGLARDIAKALLSLPKGAPALTSSELTGWVLPLSYEPVYELMQDLKSAHFSNFGEISLIEVMKQHWLWGIVIISALVLLIWFTAYVVRLNTHNSVMNRELQRELKNKESAQKEALIQKEKISNILESIADAYFSVNSDWRIISINSQAKAMFNRQQVSLIDRELWDALPALANIAHGCFIRSFEQSEPIEFVAYYPPTDQWLEFHTFPSNIEMSVYFRDVTTRVKNAELLEESEQRLRTIVENMVEGVFTVDSEGMIQSFNKAAQAMFGYRYEEVAGKSIDQLAPLAGSEHHTYSFKEYLGVDGSSDNGSELYGCRKNGEVFPIDISLSEIYIDNQPMYVGICRDISERKRAEQKTKQLVTAMKNAAEGIFITNAEGCIEYVNPAYEKLSGQNEESLLGQRATVFTLAEDNRPKYNSFFESRSQGIPWTGRYSAMRNNGVHYTEEVTIAPVRSELGDTEHYVGICRNVSDIYKQTLVSDDSYKLENTEDVDSVVQDISNLLDLIIVNTSFALGDVENGDDVSERLSELLGSANEAKLLVKSLNSKNQIQAFSR